MTNEKRLARADAKIFGVCGGLAKYFDMDVVVIRGIFLVALVVFGTGLLLYLVLALVMPKENTP